jgi:adenylosuccinate lyase
MQRDLSNSTVMRNIGTSFGYTLLAIKSLQKGLKKIKPNKKLLKKELKNHQEVLAEALQIILKKWGKQNAYTKIKEASRGKKISWEKLIKKLPKDKREQLVKWKPEKYIGLAEDLTKKEIKNIKNYLKGEL